MITTVCSIRHLNYKLFHVFRQNYFFLKPLSLSWLFLLLLLALKKNKKKELNSRFGPACSNDLETASIENFPQVRVNFHAMPPLETQKGVLCRLVKTTQHTA
jgi:hypothetical protein